MTKHEMKQPPTAANLAVRPSRSRSRGPAGGGSDPSAAAAAPRLRASLSGAALPTQEFARALAEGTAPVWLKSQPPPETNDGPVTVVVGTTFDEIVMDRTKDVLLEVPTGTPTRTPAHPPAHTPTAFRAPAGVRAVVRPLPEARAGVYEAGARTPPLRAAEPARGGPCEATRRRRRPDPAPPHTPQGKRYASVPSVVIAKMDGTGNEHEKLAGLARSPPACAPARCLPPRPAPRAPKRTHRRSAAPLQNEPGCRFPAGAHPTTRRWTGSRRS